MMEKTYNHKNVEDKIYVEWEEKGYFKPEIHQDGKPYCIILPPPNANAPLHFGHAMYVIEDILIRYHRMKGFASLWLPGADHAGFETQYVFEKHLEKEGKSRFDYDRDTLYQMIWDFVQKNKPIMENQLRKLGFSLDWSRAKFTLDDDIIKIVYQTFKRLYDDGLIYRGYRLVNYCTKDGTSFSDLEVVYEERKDPLYYIKYGPLTLATVRPETKFGDTGVAVHPKDKRFKKYIGKEIEIETVLGKAKIKVVGDEAVDPEFGTGVVKVTPAHDFNDFEIGQRHNLPLKQVIDFNGRLNEKAGKFAGMRVMQARKAVVEAMKEKGLIEKIDENYTHRVGLCYKCKTIIEPLPMEQWFIKVESMAKKAISVVKTGETKIYPKSFEKRYLQWLENIKDWNISRQIVWGIRIPAWKCGRCSKWVVTEGKNPDKCPECGSTELEQDPDTFDTWFSSGQWPFATLMTNPKGVSLNGVKGDSLQKSDFERFYPTSVMETMYDILLFWVARMVMLGIYVTGKIPFEHVVLHGMVKDPYGKKMSKSKGNVVDPLDVVEQYGADAVRFALVYGTALGSDQALSYPKLQAMRNFTNKLWNMGRFIQFQKSKIKNQKLEKGSSLSEAKGGTLSTNNLTIEQLNPEKITSQFNGAGNLAIHPTDKEWIKKTKQLTNEITKYIDSYDFNHAAQRLYDFTWHEFADKYIEDVKNRIDESSFTVLRALFLVQLKLLHPFMPFVTEELYKQLGYKGKMLIVEKWPE